ncbi:MAG TPA: hypothetical protein PLS53_03675 [Thermoanaerobaculaceae bacterium]|nr:hypothetical protein [Thermoanaerobaculaceae bacterium]HPS77236.1 hypothetical protein [Thermoanaerobaculaceae bacterium]
MRVLRFSWIVMLSVLAASASAFTINGNVKTPLGCAPEGATVELLDVSLLPGGIVKTKLLGTGFVDAAGHFAITFPWVIAVGPPMPPSFESGGPDVIVRMRQLVDGAAQPVLDESPSDTRWNLANGSTLSLTTNASALCHSGVSSAPHNNDFVFTRVGAIPTADIDCRGDIASSGYAYKSTTTAVKGNSTNQPFGGTMDLFGFFGSMSGVNRYRIQYSTDGVTFTDLSDPLSDSYYDSATHAWKSESMGPESLGGTGNLYKLPYVEKPALAWSWFNRLAVVDSRKLPDGVERFTVIGYNWNESTHTLTMSPATLHIDPAFGVIRLQIDNTPPAYSINSILRNNAAVHPCDFVTLQGADVLEIRFTAQDPLGHLAAYALSAMYGHNQVVSPAPAPPGSTDEAVDGYSNHIAATLTWNGAPEYAIQYKAATYPAAAMPTCAYQMRLSVTKRTTNGYGLIYHDLEDTWHITIVR